MELSSIIRPSAVKVINSVTSKKRLFQDLGDIFAGNYGLNSEAVTTALQERESLGPTGVGHGVALPHARLIGLDQVVGAFVRVEKPFDFEAVDKLPVDLIFALFAPEGAGVDHLKALALVSRTMRDNATCSKLRSNSDPSILHTVLTEGPSTKAA
ncbi:MAG TPA: PTS lactose transporter subunit IIC [Aliiroseovarius sp.]|nr:PTS lactose transporter subunit IIC [Aliiroseovarius sp.]